MTCYSWCTLLSNNSRLCFDIEVEADSEDEAWEKAYDTVDLGDLEVRDCEYSDDEITLLEE